MLNTKTGKHLSWLAPVGIAVGIVLATGGVASAATNVEQTNAGSVTITAPDALSWSAYRQPNLGNFSAVNLNTAVDANSDTAPTGTVATTADVAPNTGSVYRWWCLRGQCKANGWTMTLKITTPTSGANTLTDATASPEFEVNSATITKLFGPDTAPSYNAVGVGAFNFGAAETIVTADTTHSQGEWATSTTFPRVKYTISAYDVEAGTYTSTVDWDLAAS